MSKKTVCKKIIGGLLFLTTLLNANEYFAKLEPIKIYNIKSAVSGKVVYINNNIESKNIQSDIILKIDNNVNNIDLKQSKIKLKNLKEILSLEKNTLGSFKRVSSKSKFDKDNQKIKILNISSSISDLETKIATLKDTISKKVFREKNRYVYDIVVEIGDYVNPGSLLYTTMDITKGKLEIYIPIGQAKQIRSKTIYIDGVKTNLKISKLYDIADTKHISSYKCEIVIDNPKQFSRLIKIEFR